ncbi:TIGR02147 family protein [Bdellovibrio sp. PAP01]|uniref:TIGR02147 family protein n=2 Tax=Bdellovibrio svalbardensis TaxID=2972972 RepID=A0ABT6DQ21_9BACT|nr:TIGR02147 family protein [Bdellovibrio svalbardensis]
MELADFLKSQLTALQRKNSRISLRSFSRKIGISPGRVSEMLAGKRGLSEYYAEKIAHGLNLNEADQRKLFSMISIKARKNLLHQELLEKEIAMLSSWEHFAILNIMALDDFQSNESWIAMRLGLKPEQVRASLQILSDLSLISNKDGQFKRTPNRITTSEDVPSTALRKALRADIEKSLEVLEAVPPSIRDFSSMTMTIDPKKIKRAKRLITNFRDKMSMLLEKGPKSEVYNLNIQFYPMTIPQEDMK